MNDKSQAIKVSKSETWNSNRSTRCQFDPSSARMFHDFET